jgi:hypothetical protein
MIIEGSAPSSASSSPEQQHLLGGTRRKKLFHHPLLLITLLILLLFMFICSIVAIAASSSLSDLESSTHALETTQKSNSELLSKFSSENPFTKSTTLFERYWTKESSGGTEKLVLHDETEALWQTHGFFTKTHELRTHNMIIDFDIVGVDQEIVKDICALIISVRQVASASATTDLQMTIGQYENQEKLWNIGPFIVHPYQNTETMMTWQYQVPFDGKSPSRELELQLVLFEAVQPAAVDYRIYLDGYVTQHFLFPQQDL